MTNRNFYIINLIGLLLGVIAATYPFTIFSTQLALAEKQPRPPRVGEVDGCPFPKDDQVRWCRSYLEGVVDLGVRSETTNSTNSREVVTYTYVLFPDSLAKIDDDGNQVWVLNLSERLGKDFIRGPAKGRSIALEKLPIGIAVAGVFQNTGHSFVAVFDADGNLKGKWSNTDFPLPSPYTSLELNGVDIRRMPGALAVFVAGYAHKPGGGTLFAAKIIVDERYHQGRVEWTYFDSTRGLGRRIVGGNSLVTVVGDSGRGNGNGYLVFLQGKDGRLRNSVDVGVKNRPTATPYPEYYEKTTDAALIEHSRNRYHVAFSGYLLSTDSSRPTRFEPFIGHSSLGYKDVNTVDDLEDLTVTVKKPRPLAIAAQRSDKTTDDTDRYYVVGVGHVGSEQRGFFYAPRSKLALSSPQYITTPITVGANISDPGKVSRTAAIGGTYYTGKQWRKELGFVITYELTRGAGLSKAEGKGGGSSPRSAQSQLSSQAAGSCSSGVGRATYNQGFQAGYTSVGGDSAPGTESERGGNQQSPRLPGNNFQEAVQNSFQRRSSPPSGGGSNGGPNAGQGGFRLQPTSLGGFLLQLFGF